MPRRKKEVFTLTEQLQSVEAEITSCRGKIKELEQKKKVLLKKIAEEEKDALYDAAMRSGRGLKECIALLNEQAQGD